MKKRDKLKYNILGGLELFSLMIISAALTVLVTMFLTWLNQKTRGCI